MSRVKNPTRGPRARAAETAAATAALAEADTTTRSAREQRQRKIGTLRSIRKNLLDDPGDPTYPLSSAFAKARMIEQLEADLGLSPGEPV